MLVQLSHRLQFTLSSWRRHLGAVPVRRATLLLASLGVTASVLGLRQLGLLQPMELWAYDQLLRSRPPEKPDPRLLVVTVTEDDIQRVGRFPLPDGTVATLLAKLQQYQPRVIGLDILRDLPVEPGHSQFVPKLKSDRLIVICKKADDNSPGVKPPPTIAKNQVGFSDLVVDQPGGVIRRALLLAQTDAKCSTPFSFSFQLATRYLAQKGIEPTNRKSDHQLQIGKTLFPRLDANAGSYQGVDARGYQILLNYRAADTVARQVTLSQVFNNQVKPEWVRDRIILIGTSAPSAKDSFYTPYSPIQQHPKLAGVMIHAQIVSQILSAVLDHRPLLTYWPGWGEILWIWGWSLLGGLAAIRLRHPLWLGLSTIILLAGLSILCYGSLRLAVWIPLIPPALAAIATSGTVVVYIAYQMQQQQEKMASLAQEQDATMAMLTNMLKQAVSTTVVTVSDNDDTTLLTSNEHQPSKEITQLLDGRYRIVRILGQGGFGQTYLAEDTKRPGNPICVVKHLKPARRDPKFLLVARRLFETEAKILEILGQHNQIPLLLAYFEEKEEFYLIQEYIEGDSLSEEIPIDRRLSESKVVEILMGVLEVLAFVHSRRVIHRDIKPTNIIRRKQDGKLVLIDFGAVKQLQPLVENETEYQTVAIGTRGYAPPEQFAGQPRTNSDIFALGIIGVQALTGIAPHQLQLDPVTATIIWRQLANVSAEVAEILDKMIRPHFGDRYQSALEVLEDLHRLDYGVLNTQATPLSIDLISDIYSDQFSEQGSQSWGSTITNTKNEETKVWMPQKTPKS